MGGDQYVAERLAEIAERRDRAARSMRDGIARVMDLYDTSVARLDEQAEQYETRREDLLVFVRKWHRGPYPYVYHLSRECGQFPHDPDVLLQSEAEERGLRLCTRRACESEVPSAA